MNWLLNRLNRDFGFLIGREFSFFFPPLLNNEVLGLGSDFSHFTIVAPVAKWRRLIDASPTSEVLAIAMSTFCNCKRFLCCFLWFPTNEFLFLLVEEPFGF